LDATEERKRFLYALCDIFEQRQLILSDLLAENEKTLQITKLATQLLEPTPVLTVEKIQRGSAPAFLAAMAQVALGVKNPFLDGVPAAKRVIAHGVLGQMGRDLLSAFMGTALEPTELWDKGAPGTAVTGRAVVVPDLNSLRADDLILLFPRHPNVLAEMLPIFESRGCRVLKYYEMLDYLAATHFREILTDCKFVPKGDM
jgi:hypothetical protein